MKTLKRNIWVILSFLFASGVVFTALRFSHGLVLHRSVTTTLGEVQVVHADVYVLEAGAKRPPTSVRGVMRLAPEQSIKTGEEGRARVRLDNGTTLVVARSTTLVTSKGQNCAQRVVVDQGRVFMQSAATSCTEMVVRGTSAVITGGTVAVESLADGKATLYCAAGEFTMRNADGEHRVHSGETATLDGQHGTIAPEKAFNDWTGGMATPWSAHGKPRGAVGELWGRLSNVQDDMISVPLSVRDHSVEANVEGETAWTRVSTTYFNAGGQPVRGDFRMALPTGAIVSRFALVTGETVREGSVHVGAEQAGDDVPRLEWAGDNWVRATTDTIPSGATLTIVVEYIEWLSVDHGRVTYRYPMVSDTAPPLLGEFHARVDASGADPRAISVSSDATVSGAVVEMHRADFRPSSDLVIELELPPKTLSSARGYLVQAEPDDPAGAYLLVRTEAPPPESIDGTALSIVIDTSLSIDPVFLDAERALAESILEGLGARDRVVVFAADQKIRPVGGSPELTSVTAGYRKAVHDALVTLRPSGATDLGMALEHAADALPSNALGGMVLYIGDGWPTLGDTNVEAIRARLSRRSAGVPRLAAVAVGALANRFGLTALVGGTGPVLTITDRAEAASVAITLLSEALKPAVSGVEIDFGSDVERVYPRGARTVLAGSTFTAVGRLRGAAPTAVTLRFRQGTQTLSEPRALQWSHAMSDEDVRRRWAALRVQGLTLRDAGHEAAVDVALRAQLLTPWTAWSIGEPSSHYAVTPWQERMLDFADGVGEPFAARLTTPTTRSGAVTEPGYVSEEAAFSEKDEDYQKAVLNAADHVLDEAIGSVHACRDSRAALRPELAGTLQVNATLNGNGRTKSVVVRATSAADDDPSVDRCVEVIVSNLEFFASELKTTITIVHEFHLSLPHDVQARTCSSTATLPLALRRGVWHERLRRSDATDVYLKAKAACELPAWADRRTLLELMLDAVPAGPDRVHLAHGLEDAGESDAANLLRREAIHRATTPRELGQIRLALFGDESKAMGAFRKPYEKASSDEGRLAVVRRFLMLAPHDSTLRRRLLMLLETLGKRDELTAEIARFRQDPFSDTALLAEGASVLRRVGQADDAERAFGEIIERAPHDPFARAYLGDRLRNEGLFNDATSVYEELSQLVPDDPAAAIRLALAHAGAGRLDVASRILQRVSQTGGRLGDQSLGELASITSAVLLAEQRALGVTAEEEGRMARQALELALPDVFALILVRTPALDAPVEAKLSRNASLKDESPASIAAPSLGLSVLRIERGDKEVRVRLRRPVELTPNRVVKAHVNALVLTDDPAHPKVMSKDVELAADGKDMELRWDGATLL